MKPFTREEEECFKTALALVVVKKRLQQKQKQTQKQNQCSNDGTLKRSHGASGDIINQKRHEEAGSKFRRTMDSLMFPWTNANTNANDNTSNSTTQPSPPQMRLPSPQSLQDSQLGHLQTILATALRTAMELQLVDFNTNKKNSSTKNNNTNSESTGGGTDRNVNSNSSSSSNNKTKMKKKPARKRTTTTTTTNTDNPAKAINTDNEENDDRSLLLLWTSLGGLTTHLAHQLSLSLSLVATTTAKNQSNRVGGDATSTSTAITKTKNWVNDWMRDHLCQLLFLHDHGDNDDDNDGDNDDDNDNSSRSLIEATFLVWHGILLGYDSGSIANNTTSSDPHRAACRGLFVQVFCDLLQQQGIFAPSSSSASSSSMAPHIMSPGPGNARRVVAGGGPPRSCSRHAWLRIFASQHNTNHRYHYNRRPGTTHLHRQRQQQQEQQQYRSNLWVVHGLQLLQKVLSNNNVGATSTPNQHHHHRSIYRSCLPPHTVLPPTCMRVTEWYVDAVDQKQQQQRSTSIGSLEQGAAPAVLATGHQHSNTSSNNCHLEDAPVGKAMDPGAKLMAMVALCQVLQDDDEPQQQQQQQGRRRRRRQVYH